MAATIVPPRTYTRVYRTLLALTLLTWGACHLHLPHPLALVVALTIAMSKALLPTFRTGALILVNFYR